MNELNITQETDTSVLSNAASVAQFELNVYNRKKLITLIGEFHTHTYDCNSGTRKTVTEYCINRLDSNPKCNLLLEYNEKMCDKHLIGSDIIKDIFGKEDYKQYHGRVFGVDNRCDMLSEDDKVGQKKQQTLYQSSPKKFFGAFDHEAIKSSYLSNFNSKNLENNIRNDQQGGQLHRYVNTLKAQKDQLGVMMDETIKRNENMLQELRRFWANVMDFEVLKQIIYSDDKANEIVVVIGQYHQINLFKVFTELYSLKPIRGTDHYAVNESSKIKCINIGNLKKVQSTEEMLEEITKVFPDVFNTPNSKTKPQTRRPTIRK